MACCATAPFVFFNKPCIKYLVSGRRFTVNGDRICGGERSHRGDWGMELGERKNKASAWDLRMRSEPARSANSSVRFIIVAPPSDTDVRCRCTRQCEREERSSFFAHFQRVAHGGKKKVRSAVAHGQAHGGEKKKKWRSARGPQWCGCPPRAARSAPRRPASLFWETFCE